MDDHAHALVNFGEQLCRSLAGRQGKLDRFAHHRIAFRKLSKQFRQAPRSKRLQLIRSDLFHACHDQVLFNDQDNDTDPDAESHSWSFNPCCT
jgi:hypothetical protein